MSQSPRSLPARTSARRGRISRACVACQQRKQKCDGGTPACRNCLRSKRTCISHDPATNRRHPRGYIEALEQHVALMETTLRELHPELDVDSLGSGVQNFSSTANHHREKNSTSSREENDPLTPDLPETSAVNASLEGPSDLDVLCLRAAGGEPHYFGSSSAFSFTKMFSATLRAVRAQGPGLTMSGISDVSVQCRPDPTPAPLPDKTATTILTTAYFEQVHPQFPFLHRPTYLQWEDGVMRACREGSSPNPTHLFFVYAVAAVGALTGCLAGNTLPEGLYASAEQLFEHVIKLNTLESIQAILCCCMYSIRSPVGVSVWTLSGLALRQCIELGLHRKILWSKVKSDVLKIQMRRRVFWCCYNLDRAVAVTLGRPVGINDTDIDVENQHPLDIDDENVTVSGLLAEPRASVTEPPTTISGAIHTIRLRQIWARIQSSMYPQTEVESSMPTMNSLLIGNFKEELRTWLESAPEQLNGNRAHCNAFCTPEWYELMYHHSIILLYQHRFVSHRTSQGNEDTHFSAYLECAESAQKICHIYRRLYTAQRLHDTWGALHVLFLGGVTFLHCLWVCPETRAAYRIDKVSATITSCMMVFAVMAERWTAVKPYRDAFDMLSNATQAMLIESATTVTAPAMPVLSCSTNDQLPDYLSDIAEIGMCSSVEALLCDMID